MGTISIRLHRTQNSPQMQIGCIFLIFCMNMQQKLRADMNTITLSEPIDPNQCSFRQRIEKYMSFVMKSPSFQFPALFPGRISVRLNDFFIFNSSISISFELNSLIGNSLEWTKSSDKLLAQPFSLNPFIFVTNFQYFFFVYFPLFFSLWFDVNAAQYSVRNEVLDGE